jgi:hypothetical protein
MALKRRPIDPPEEHLIDAIVAQPRPARHGLRRRSSGGRRGLLLPTTLAQHLGLKELVDEHLDLGDKPGAANVGDKLLTLVMSALAGGDSSMTRMPCGSAGRSGSSASASRPPRPWARSCAASAGVTSAMPQAAAGYTSYGEGGALALDQSEHVLTRTYGFRGGQTLIADVDLTFRQVLAKDIWDVRSIVGGRYNSGLKDLIDYYRTNFPDLIAKGGGL